MLPAFKLCYVTGPEVANGGLVEEVLTQAAAAGIDLIQVRGRNMETRALLRLAERAVTSARGTTSQVVINDRLDIALGLGAAGVHLGNHSMPAERVRAITPSDFLVGVSCHSLKEALAAESAGADYILLGPVFETPSKVTFGPPIGLDLVREVGARVATPILAIGGITLERVKPCLEAGASGVAAIRLFQDAPSLTQRVTELRAQFHA